MRHKVFILIYMYQDPDDCTYLVLLKYVPCTYRELVPRVCSWIVPGNFNCLVLIGYISGKCLVVLRYITGTYIVHIW